MAKVACIGTGLVGSAWAVVFSRGGHTVSLFDSGGGEVEPRTRAAILETLEMLDRSSALTEPVADIEARISFAPTLADAITDTVHVQESVKEDIQVKQAVFAEIGRHAPADAVLASSTSAFAGSLFMDFDGAERGLVAHPVNPPSLIPLVELCGTPKTSAETVERAKTFMTELGMKPIVIRKEIDGFILNRLQYTLVAEALHLVGEGYCDAADIDRVITDGLALRWSTIGPFEVAHLNSPHGYEGFVNHLGDMMRRMGRNANTAYDWPEGLTEAVHAEMVKRVPLDQLKARQAWRDENILATRQVQHDAEKR
ncbi:3-hydroxyacyl-CoA dehydrogenase [Rhizobium sp. NPDC090275]|uniref:3-hydroxyacyl-CoA dehydrogenase n=1 Tax=Rhizobium sp. NPDC090275 TaxID=3364498 RepID=UPI00383B9C23